MLDSNYGVNETRWELGFTMPYGLVQKEKDRNVTLFHLFPLRGVDSLKIHLVLHFRDMDL